MPTIAFVCSEHWHNGYKLYYFNSDKYNKRHGLFCRIKSLIIYDRIMDGFRPDGSRQKLTMDSLNDY